MAIAHWALLVAALLPLACTYIAKSGMFAKRRRDGGFDNRDPRAWLAKQTGWRARANAAQANSFEALPFFVAGVLVAQQVGVPQARVDALAVAFVVLRVAFIALYLADRPTLRSAVWALGFGCCVALFALGAF